MSDTVSIPVETARAIAAWLRSDGGDAPSATVDAWADALDPRPTLRDAVARAMHATAYPSLPDAWILWIDAADASLAYVRDHIAARPHPLGLDYAHDTATEAFRAALLADLGADR